MEKAKKVGAIAAVLVLGIGFWWPWDGIDTREVGEYTNFTWPPGTDSTTGIPQGWQFAPFAGGLNPAVLAAFMVQLIPLESAQTLGCMMLTPQPSDPRQQIYMGIYLKGIDTAAKALRRYPDSMPLQGACINLAAQSCLFNRHTTVAAGKAGIVELATAAFMKFKTDASFQNLGNMGCFFDYSPENVKKFRDIGGIPFVHDVIKTHYWNNWVQFMSFCAYSSGCASGSELTCATEPGLIETMVKVMKDHRTNRVREEVMQVIKSVCRAGPKYRLRLVEEGMVPQLVQVLEERTDSKTDQSVGCECIHHLISPSLQFGKENATFVSEMQTLIAKEGAISQIVKSVDLAQELTLGEGFGGQNAAALQQYNIERSCFFAISALVWRHPANQNAFVHLGVLTKIVAALEKRPEEEAMVAGGCYVLKAISEGNATNKLAVDTAKTPAISDLCTRKLPTDFMT